MERPKEEPKNYGLATAWFRYAEYLAGQLKALKAEKWENKYPMKVKHKLFGNVDVLGERFECESNNNHMYLVKNDDKYYWIYDYETETLTSNPK